MNSVSRFNKLASLIASLLFCFNSSLAQTANEATLQAGKVIDKVVVLSHRDESYALFLPANYTPDRRWPTIFCLDPRARGKSAIERFVEPANDLGYVVLCSNNSRNGLDWRTISDIFTNFWDDAHSRISIDENRTYAAGFSGGSRLATTFASRCRGCLAGVIACGAGFPADISPDEKTSFAYFGVSGVDDFNYSEMWALERKFSELDSPYYFETFEGAHEWPPADSLKRALAWLILQSMKAGTSERNELFIDAQLSARTKDAEQLRSTERLVDAYRAYRSIDRDFKGLRDTRNAADALDQLKKSAQLRKQEKTEEDLFQRQIREAGEIRMLWLKSPEPDAVSVPRHDATIRLAEWRKKKDAADASPDRRLARRIISHLLIEAYETAQASLRNKDYDSALANLQLAHETEPKGANLVYEIARVYGLKRQRKPALDSLEKAVTLGFKDLSRLKSDDAFVTLSDDPRLQKLLASLSIQ